MKPFSKQTSKWLLSAAMIAALGSQYYFSVSSNSIGSFEMSSQAEELTEKLSRVRQDGDMSAEDKDKTTTALIAEYAPKIKAENGIGVTKPAAAKPATAKPSAAKPVADKNDPVQVIDGDKEFRVADEQTRRLKASPSPIKLDADQLKKVQEAFAGSGLKISTDGSGKLQVEPVKVEGQNPSTDCKECQQFTFTTTPEIALQISNFLSKAKPGTIAAAPAKTDVAKTEDVKFETPHERYEREKEEREAARERKAQAKRDKDEAKAQAARDKKDERNEKFADKAEQMADRCGENLDCKISGFTNLLSSFKDKSNNVDSFVVMKAYNEYIDRDLKDALRSDDSTTRNNALQAINSLMSSVPSEYRSIKTRTVDSAKLAQVSQAAEVNDMYKQAELLKNQHRPGEEAAMRGQAMQADTTFRNEVNQTYSTIKQGLSSVNDTATMDYLMKNYVPDIQTIVNNLTNLSGINANNSTATNVNRGGRTGNTNGSAISSTVNTSGNILNGINFGTPSTTRTGTRTGVTLKN